MAELNRAAMRVLAAMRRSYDDEPTRCRIAADILEALTLEEETLYDVEDELMPAVRAVRTDRILTIAAQLQIAAELRRGGANG